MPARDKFNNGYTLLELLVVMAIMGLIAAFAAPIAGQAIESATLKANARAAVSALRQQQRLAVDQQRTIVVTPQSLMVRKADFQLDPGATISLMGDAGQIEFYPDGTASGGEFQLQEGHHAINIEVAWLTGTISVGDSP